MWPATDMRSVGAKVCLSLFHKMVSKLKFTSDGTIQP